MLWRATELVRVGGREEEDVGSRSLVVLLLRVWVVVVVVVVLLLLFVVLTSRLLLLTLTSLLLLSLPLVPGLEPPGDSSGTSLICLGISGLSTPAPIADLGVGGALFGFDASCTLPPPGWAI